MRKTMLWILTALLAVSTAHAERPVDATRSVAADAEISIETVAGSVTVVGGDAAELRVTGTIGDDVEELRIDGDAGKMTIEVVVPDGDDWGNREIGADLEVVVPRGASLEVETVSAKVAVREVGGAIEVETVSGGIDVAGGSSPIEAESVSGNVDVRGGSSVEAESVSGRVTLTGSSGALEATTVSGKIHIEAGPVSDVEIESVSGSVHFKGQLGSSGSLEVDTHSGNAEVHLPAGLEARFEIQTFSGRIDNGFGPSPKRRDRYEPGLVAEFVTGSGGAEVTIESFSGNISLKGF